MAERFIFTSSRRCPVHDVRLERSPGQSAWRCPVPRCNVASPRQCSAEWLEHLRALNICKPREAA